MKIRSTKILTNVRPLGTDLEVVSRTKPELIDIALADENGKLVYQTLIQPNNCNLSDEKKRKGYTEDALSRAPKLEEVLPTIYAIIETKLLVFWNEEYDLSIFPQLAEKAYATVCAMKRYSAAYGVRNPYFGNNTYVSLSKAAERIGNPGHKLVAHTAASDAIATAEIWKWMEDQNLPLKHCDTDMIPITDYEKVIQEKEILKQKCAQLESKSHLEVVKPSLSSKQDKIGDSDVPF